MANSFDTKYADAIKGLAAYNNVDTGQAAAMLRSNLTGSSSYKGGGIVDYGQASKDLADSNTNTGTSGTTSNNLYALQEKKRLSALDAARRSGLSALANEKTQIDPYYNKAISTVSGNSATGARNLAEYLAQRGQTSSGVAAQAEMNRTALLNSNVSNLEAERANKYADIAARETAIQNTYDQGAAQAKLDRQSEELQAYQDAQKNAAALEQEYQKMGYANDLAKSLAEYKSGLALNNSLAAIQERAKYKTTSSGSGGSNGGSTSAAKEEKPRLTYSQAYNAYQNGTVTPEVENALLYYSGTTGNSNYDDLVSKVNGMTNLLGKKSWIQYYNENGKISDTEATYLLKKFGIVG